MYNECRICVIGAGLSGLTAAKTLIDAGLRPTIFEQSNDVGGLWAYSERPSHSSVSEFTHIISSKTLSQYIETKIPVYRLAAAQRAIREAYPQDVVQYRFTFSYLRKITAACQLYDFGTHEWLDFSGRAAARASWPVQGGALDGIQSIRSPRP